MNTFCDIIAIIKKRSDRMIEKINEASLYIKNKLPFIPEMGIVLGSGLGPLATLVKNPIEIDYKDIPHFPTPTIASHAGKLVIGTIKGKKVIILNGRFHYYEGHDIFTNTLPVRVFKKLGINTLIVTNACGGLHDNMEPGTISIIEDHISLFAPSPLRGPNLDEFGPRFKDMSEVYDPKLKQLAFNVAKKLDIPITSGVYCFCQGPMFETPAEIRLLKQLGVGMVGMSTVPEAIVARHSDMRTLGISLVTNKAAGLSASLLSHEEVMEAANLAEKNMVSLVSNIIEEMEI